MSLPIPARLGGMGVGAPNASTWLQQRHAISYFPEERMKNPYSSDKSVLLLESLFLRPTMMRWMIV